MSHQSATSPAPADPAAPYGYAPNGQPYSHRSRSAAAWLTFFFGYLGVGRFYTGHIKYGVIQLLTCGGLLIWAIIDWIRFLTNKESTDAEGRILR